MAVTKIAERQFGAISTGLTNTSGTITANLSVGVSGGQSVIGGSASGNSLTLSSTSHATKGKVLFGTSGYDEVNNRLGIGTSSPAAKLDVNLGVGSAINSIAVRNTSSNGYSSITMYDDRNSSSYISQWGLYGSTFSGNASNTFFYNSAGGGIGFYIGNGNNPSSDLRLLATNTGNIGIGTDSPTSISNYITQTINGLSGSISEYRLNGANQFRIGTEANTSFINAYGLGVNLDFSVNAAQRMRIATTGNVLVNTTADAGYKLDVNGTTRTQGDFTISDTKNIILATGTGTKIGTGTTQKLAFFNSTPIVQPANTVAINDVLVNLGLRASGGSSNFTTNIDISTKDIVTDGTTGTKIGTGTSQKIGFWNAAPIAQPTTGVAASTLVSNGGTALTDTDTFDGYTLKQIVKALRNAGLLA